MFDVNLELQGGLKVRDSEINFIILEYKRCSKQKNHRGLITETFKIGTTNPQGFFYLSNFCIKQAKLTFGNDQPRKYAFLLFKKCLKA